MTETPRADALLQVFLTGAYEALQEGFVALYLDGEDEQVKTLRGLMEQFAALPDDQEHEKAFSVLTAMLSDPDSRLRYWAIKALVAIGDRRAVEFLRDSLGGMDSTVVFEATTEALVALSDLDAILPLLLHPWANYNTHMGLKGFNSEDLVHTLGNILTHPDELIRTHVMLCLQDMKHPEAISLSIQAMDDENDYIRAIGVSNLIGVAETVPVLLAHMSDSHPDVRRYITQALGESGDRQAIPSLLPLLEDDDADIQLRAAFALGKLGSPAGSATIHRYLASCDHAYTLGWLEDALKALRVLGEPLLSLLLALDERLPIQISVGHRAQLLIAEIFAEGGDPAVLPVLERMGEQGDEDIRVAVQQAIETIMYGKTW
jgi:HEAT repeat protein